MIRATRFFGGSMAYRLALLVLVSLLSWSPVCADTPPKESARESSVQTPSELAPWVEWVKERNPYWRCARRQRSYECSWPGTLKYVITPSGADFTIAIEMLTDGPVLMPSNPGLFPRRISVKGEGGEAISAPLELQGGQLFIRLPRGRFEVRGSFSWTDLPPEIPAPGSYGLVEVKTPGELGELRTRRGPESLWLEKEEIDATTESLTFSVMRRISDGAPLQIETLLRARISGRSRPLQIPAILPQGSVPVSLESPLPAQLSQDGALALQLLPGEYEVRLLSLMQQPVAEIKVPSIEFEGWPKEEIWSWQPDMGFRSVELTGGQPVHADLTQLPQEWKGGAIYVLGSGSGMKLNETRRGEQSQAPNSISIQRKVWIDLEGSGATVQDNFTGTLHRDFRINALPETKVGRATVDSQPALVTTDPKTGASGVELRSQNLNMEVVSSLADSRSLHTVGWDTTADRIGITLNLPPSWKLIHAAGAAEARGSWVDSWSLLHIFVAILLILAAYKLFGVTVALVLGVSLLLNHNEFLPPKMLYIHLLLLACWRLLTEGRESVWRTLSKTLLAITYCAWALQSLAFAKLQFTQVLFPQLQAGTRYRTILQRVIFGLEDSLIVWPLMLVLLAVAVLGARYILQSTSVGRAIWRMALFGVGFVFLSVVLSGIYGTFVRSSGYSSYPQQSFDQTANLDDSYSRSAPEQYLSLPSSIPQGFGGKLRSKGGAPMEMEAANTAFSYQGKNLLSGPAVPAWRWRAHEVSIASPVGPDHTLRFYLLSPGLSRILSALRAALALALIVLLFRALGYSLGPVRRLSATAAGLLLVLTLGLPSLARADTPSPEILNELQTRLSKNICESDECAVIEAAEFSFTESAFKVSLQVSSWGVSSVAVPGPLDAVSPRLVTVNGKPAVAMRRNDAGYLVVRTDAGKNIIELEGELLDPQAVSVQFPLRPLHVSVNAPQWFVEGLSGTGSIQENLRFVKRASKQRGDDAVVSPRGTSQGLHTWVRVRRQLTIGDQISLNTTIERIGSIARETHIRIPLLSKEQVTSGAVSIENNELLVGFSVEERESSFTSVLPYGSEIELKARPMPGVSEEWTVVCQPIVGCDFSGIRPTNTTLSGTRAFQWLPFPEERVGVKIQPLAGLRGDFVTVDDVRHEVRWGTNLLEGTLTASVRATQQTTFRISAPGDSSIRSVTLDGQAGRSAESGTESSVLLSPGAHAIALSYSKSWSPALKESVPVLSVSAPVNNLTITVQPSADRWILWTGGLPWGPCVVFWAKMLLIIAICVALVRLGLIPGSTPGAVLLGIGLSTLPIVLMIIPLGWLGALMIIPVLEGRLMIVPRWIRAAAFILLTFIAIVIWYHIVQTGLVLAPPMLVAGNGSSVGFLRWYTDHAQGALPAPWVISLPIWTWRVVALIWSTWLVVALFGWLRRCVAIIRSDFMHASKPVAAPAS